MKKFLFILSAFSVFSFSSQAAIWRVNGNTGVSANFSDLPAACTAANAGDTILVEPMNNNAAYSGVSLSKKLVILGNGYFNDAVVNGGIHTMNAGLQANQKTSVVNGVTFGLGSEYSVIMGLSTSTVSIYVSKITVRRCYTWYIYLNNYNPNTGLYSSKDSINISQNIIGGQLTTNQFSTTGGYSITDVNIQNNLFGGTYYYGVTLPVGVSGYFQNNIFDNGGAGISMWNFQVSNNILVNGSFTANNCVYFNNISTSTQFGNQNNNQQNISTTSLFTNYSGTGLTETRYNLAAAGPGVGAGFNGVDVGIFGGPDPYKLSGIPPIPAIYSLSAPSTTTSTTLPVTISTRSNN